MKIGIFTYHRAHNYGGVLQCYALANKIEELGFEVEVVDYQCPFFLKQYKKISILNLPSIKKLLSIVIHNGNVKYNGDNFNRFVSEHIPLTGRMYSRENIGSLDGSYDKFITGSDQVWSPFCSGFDKTYFLDFASNTQKCAYAASFGVEHIDDIHKSEYKRLLADFDKVTLREASGQELFKSFTNRYAPVAVDPTLLLNASDWKKLIDDKFKSRRYVLVYMIAESSNTLNLAKSIAKEKGIEVIYLSDRLFKRSGVTTLSQVSVTDWLSLFFHAELVVTNSFHGIAFSINFNKNFYVQFLPGKAKTNTRIKNILSLFDLQARLISSQCNSIHTQDIENYEQINTKLDELRLSSIDYLKDILS